jgi:hypothetical protein
LEDVSVTADTEICTLEGVIENNGISLISLQCFFEAAGRLYVETPSGKRHYLTDPNQDYPAKFQIISSYFLPKGQTVSLKYSASTTMTGLVTVACGGVF